MTTLPVIIGIIAVIAVLFVFTQLLVKPIKWAVKILINSGIGLLLLVMVNYFGQAINFSLPINLVTVLIAGFLGVPGILLMIALEVFL